MAERRRRTDEEIGAILQEHQGGVTAKGVVMRQYTGVTKASAETAEEVACGALEMGKGAS